MNIIAVVCVIVCVSSVQSNYYELLGVPRDADNREIRKAFKTLALKLHPDKNLEKPDAHGKFLEINEAYEVLKDPDLRKKYDLHGKEGLKEDFGKTWNRNYQSWTFYHENFGIYDDDKEVVTLNRNDFEESVFESSDIWFINFYSPNCLHCHNLAPAWRRLAQYFDGVLRIGAVNCEDDYILCHQQHIRSYPSLILYPKNEKYHGRHEFESMKEHVMGVLPLNIIKLDSENFDKIVTSKSTTAWLIFTCQNLDGCIDSDDLKKLSILLENLVNVAEVNPKASTICSILSCDASISFYGNLSSASERKSISIKNSNVQEIVEEVLQHLPDFQELFENNFEDTRIKLESSSFPILVKFFKSETQPLSSDIYLKRVQSIFPDITFAYLNCQKFPNICNSLFIQKFPTLVHFKSEENYEVHYGAFTVFDVTKFLRETSPSFVKTLTPYDFPYVTESSQSWIIDFFAPWCAPCIQFMPHWRKASTLSPGIKFGSMDCTIHTNLCRKYNIHSYPTVILYNQTIPHKYHGRHSSEGVKEFIKDILHPHVISLTPTTFKKLINMKEAQDIWVLDFFAPWCNPCQQLSVQWRKTAKSFLDKPNVKIGEVDCEKYNKFCFSLNIQNYPTIRLYPTGSTGSEKFIIFNGRNRDFQSLRGWIYQFLPSKVKSFSSSNFQDILFDTKPWIIDFYAPWCGYCHRFVPEFEKIAEAVDGEVSCGKINCDDNSNICQFANVNAYPTILFYGGRRGESAQDARGAEIKMLTYDGVINFLKKKLDLSIKITAFHDEL